MAVFCKLNDPENYRPCDWDLLTDDAGREYWLDEFRDHAKSMLAFAAARPSGPGPDRLAAMRDAYHAALDAVRRDPGLRGRLDVLELCILRDEYLQEYEIGDPYVDVKQQENALALRRFPEVVRRLDDTPADGVVESLMRGVLAGNRFDLGSPATTSEYSDRGIDFFSVLDALKPRPWFTDDLEAMHTRLAGDARYRKAMVFADNAGADAILGILPLARYLATRGTGVVIAATSHYALNDITKTELDTAIESASAFDPVLAEQVRSGLVRTVGTGYTHPLIDLSDISDACNEAADACDLVILEGMGRAVESNYRTAFRCDSIRLAMVKNEAVADHYGCGLFDLVCRFDTSAETT